MLNSGVLVLNRAFFPVHITSVRRAFCLLYAGLARAINSLYEMFDFQSWSELSIHTSEEAIGLVGRMIRVPRVVVLTAYDQVPRRNVRFCRRNIFGRDRNTCQYCGKVFPTNELNLDHVIPRPSSSRGNPITCSTRSIRSSSVSGSEPRSRLLSIPAWGSDAGETIKKVG